MSNYFDQATNFKEIAKKENTFNYNIASLGDIYRHCLEPPKEQKQYDILSEQEMYSKGLIPGRAKIGYKNYIKPNFPQDKNINNVNINNIDLGKGLSKNINFNQGKSPGILKGNKIKYNQRPSSAISTKKIKYNQEFDPAQKNRIMDVNYLHLTKLPESKKFSHVDKAIIHPVQSTFSVKKIVEDNIKKHEKMMRPIVLYPDPVKIYNQQPDKILPGSLRRSQEEIKQYENESNARKNMIVIGKGFDNKNVCKDNHVIFEPPKEKKFRRKATSTKSARNTLRDSEKFVDALENYFLSTDLKVPPKNEIKTILDQYAKKLEESLKQYEGEISGKKKMNDDISKFIYQTTIRLKNKKRKRYNIKKDKKPKISEIDYEFRKKIQERLSRLQINLRQIFDNISILKKNRTKQNIKLINEQIQKARELTNYVRHLATDVENGEKEFQNSFQRNKSSSPKKKNKNIILNNSNNSFNNLSNSTSNMPQQNNNISLSRTMNNFNHPNINLDNNNTNNNSQLNMSKTNPHIENNQLEYSSTSIGSNINPINSFSSENKNIIAKQSSLPQGQSQNSTLMTSKANLYMKSKNFNPIIEESTEDVNYNQKKPNTNDISSTQKGNNANSNYFLQSTNTFKDIKEKENLPKITKPKSKSNIKPINKKNQTKPNQDSKMITISLAEPAYFKQKPLASQDFRGTSSISLSNPKSSDILTKSHVINNIDQTINHVPMKAEEMKVNTQNYIEDERYSAFNVEFPIKYYYELSREHEPPKNKEWFLRPHHTETFVDSKKAIPDDLMNTKYISYYAPDTTEKKKSRQDVIEELIMETRARINELQEDMFKKSNMDSESEKLYNKLEGLKEEAKKTFKPGYRDAKEAKQKNIFEMLKDPNSGASYTEMFDQNDDIKQTNFAISSVGTMLCELRDKERDLVNIKRQQEYERIRPPIDRWYELKGDNFLNEIIRNKMVLNSGPEYFQKIDELQNDELY